MSKQTNDFYMKQAAAIMSRDLEAAQSTNSSTGSQPSEKTEIAKPSPLQEDEKPTPDVPGQSATDAVMERYLNVGKTTARKDRAGPLDRTPAA